MSRTTITTIALIALVLAICGMAMHVTGDDNACSAAGGHLEFAATRFTEHCVRNGQVIEP